MWSACLDHKFAVQLVLLICPTKVQLVGCTFTSPFSPSNNAALVLHPGQLQTIVSGLGCHCSEKEYRPLDHAANHLDVSWGVVAELVQLVGPRVYVKYPRPHTRIEFGGVGGPRSRETQKLHLLIQRADRQQAW